MSSNRLEVPLDVLFAMQNADDFDFVFRHAVVDHVRSTPDFEYPILRAGFAAYASSS